MNYTPKQCPQCKCNTLEDTQTRIRFETAALAVYRCQACHHEIVAPIDTRRIRKTA